MRYRFQSRDQEYEILLETQGYHLLASLDGVEYELEVLDSQPGELSLRFAGRPVKIYWAEQAGRKWISLDGCTYLLEQPLPRGSRRSGESVEGSVRAPMPAQVRAVYIASGDLVEKGQTLMLLEAMKMEIRVQAPRPGKVTRVLASSGDTVDRDQLLVEIEKAG